MKPLVTYRCGNHGDKAPLAAGLFVVQGRPVLAHHGPDGWERPVHLDDGGPVEFMGQPTTSAGANVNMGCSKHSSRWFFVSGIAEHWHHARVNGPITVRLTEVPWFAEAHRKSVDRRANGL